MYEDLLNFLLAKKKRLLSEEEADKLMELIAQSMDMEDEYREKTDNTALIKKILDNVDVEDMISSEESSEMRNVIDDLFFEDYSSGSTECDMAALYGSDDMAEPLSRRKFKRGNFGGGTGVEASKGRCGKKTIGIKEDNRRAKAKDVLGSEGGRKRVRSVENDSAALDVRGEDVGTQDVGEEDGQGTEVSKEFQLPGFAKTEGGGKDTEDREIPSSGGCGDEFQFELGDLKDVKCTGPDFKFFDENGDEL